MCPGLRVTKGSVQTTKASQMIRKMGKTLKSINI